MTFGDALRKKFIEIGQYDRLRNLYLDGGWEAVRVDLLGIGGPYHLEALEIVTEKMVADDGGWEAFCREMFPGCLPPDPNPDYTISRWVREWSAANGTLDIRTVRPIGESQVQAEALDRATDMILTLPRTKQAEEEDLRFVVLKERSRRNGAAVAFAICYGLTSPERDPDPDPTT